MYKEYVGEKQNMKRPFIILTGPTAVGKTELSISLAKAADGEIISADSMQVYKYMDIGSAKIKKDEMQGIPHHLIDEFEPEDTFHVVRFKEYADKYMRDIYDRGRIPILVGGTGFYIQAVLYDIDFTENGNNNGYREELAELVKVKGNEHLHEMLRTVDPLSAGQIHANNVKRVIRALEYYQETGQPLSQHNEQERLKTSPYEFAYFVLNDKREHLYPRIDQRVDKMVDAGLIDEVKMLKERGCSRDLVSMQGLGYKEILAYLEGECTLEEAIYTLKRDTRHFAKRQLTWFKREREVVWLNKAAFAYDNQLILERMLEILKEKGILTK